MTESIDRTKDGAAGRASAAPDRSPSGDAASQGQPPVAAQSGVPQPGVPQSGVPHGPDQIALSGIEPPGDELYALLPELGRRIAEEEVPEELHRLASALGGRGGKA